VAALITLSELKDYLGDAPASQDDSLLTELIDNVSALFESETGRTPGAYQAGGTARTETHNGKGSADLWLDYPVTNLTSVKIGFDPANPDETLNVSDKQVINWATTSRRISRVDGGRFGIEGQSRVVQVVYDYGSDLPDSAKLGIKSVCAVAYRRRGSEEVKSESVGAFYSRTMLEKIADSDPFWEKAVANNLRVAIA
jgi:hypothetical protein